MTIDDLCSGLELGPSDWLEVGQDRIDAFARATGDEQWIHVDPERAQTGPFGTTIAHGYLTLSLISAVAFELLPVEAKMAVNYGLDRVRFPSIVPAGSRVRGRLLVEDIAEVAGDAVQVKITATIERAGSDRPVCVAGLVFRYYR